MYIHSKHVSCIPLTTTFDVGSGDYGRRHATFEFHLSTNASESTEMDLVLRLRKKMLCRVLLAWFHLFPLFFIAISAFNLM